MFVNPSHSSLLTSALPVARFSSNDKETQRRVYVKKLEELGFPKDLIDDAVRYEKEVGPEMMRLEPSPDLLERTMDRCQHLFPPPLSPWKRFWKAVKNCF